MGAGAACRPGGGGMRAGWERHAGRAGQGDSS